MSCKIVIPSHKRADRVLSKKLFCDPIICVEESQKKEYEEFNPECEIVTHPDSIKGLVPKRNWMVSHFGELFMVDDDVSLFCRKYMKPGEASAIKDRSEITHHVYSLYEMAKMMGVSLFGFTKNPRPEFYDEFNPITFRQMITGCAYGVIPSENTHWMETLQLKEDFWISCYIKYKERLILCDTRYGFVQKDTFMNPGGLSSIRNLETEKENMLLIKKYFGDSIKLKRSKYSKLEHNISCSFKI